jgi:GNAT superfamily N-acetyltransferase
LFQLFLDPMNIREIDESESDAKKVWVDTLRKTFIAEDDGQTLGTYYLKTNQAGPGMHVCNCGYMVSSLAQGKWVATVMCNHSQQIAKILGNEAMQFNYVASSNDGAIRVWLKLGFDIVGRLPRAFNHPTQGYVDALVMFRWLER